MIYVDIEKEEMEFRCSTETMIQEMAMVMSTIILDHVRDEEYPMPLGLMPVYVDSITEKLGAMVKAAVEMGVSEDYGEEELSEERSDEEIRTVVKQFRRSRRPS